VMVTSRPKISFWPDGEVMDGSLYTGCCAYMAWSSECLQPHLNNTEISTIDKHVIASNS
jgi:hypothetical protein